MAVRVRFAPSPTGHIHVGNVRTALFNYLFARNQKGSFILRIEDTDLERSTLESEKLIYEDLQWLGLDWDEGPIKGGDYGPYKQTERFDIYKKYVQKLLDEGKAYKCFCSKEELEEMKEKALKEGKPPRYNGKCRNLTPQEIEALEKEGKKASIRFKVEDEEVTIYDIIKGEITFKTDAFGDFIIVRPDGTPVYNFVVVIDDALMKITHVIRGDDHLSNTPKQVLIYRALGFEVPKFAHIPMILGPDHSKLSKRHGDTSVNQFREKGYLPEALFNYLALLSWSHPEEKEVLSKEELIEAFSLDRVSKSAAVFDFEKLKWMNGIYIRNKSKEELAKLCVPYLVSSGLVNEAYVEENFDLLADMIESVKDNLELLSDISQYIEVYFKLNTVFDEKAKELLALETSIPVLKTFLSEIEKVDKLDEQIYKSIVKNVQKSTGAKGKSLFMVIRIGVSGLTKGPELDKLVINLGKDEVIKRVKEVLELIEKQ
ncbi:glutamate--tRNA ligase [Deferribacter autotrophicus]|uniref:Glutamate--tRNA ligase n=1 Tax=Deferribacter autotrophicus TaxID=500465 RepID=A0A5A8F7B1_9BACT|nr:glutamate--tRNA ligase [Deferribacter autotrophicus]KAA0259483.1 glutamate--tRNA ligase [Deferribacter autotrophicus]